MDIFRKLSNRNKELKDTNYKKFDLGFVTLSINEKRSPKFDLARRQRDRTSVNKDSIRISY